MAATQPDGVPMEGVREYAEEMPVYLTEGPDGPRVTALNEAGYNRTDVDIVDLIRWLKANRPELLR